MIGTQPHPLVSGLPEAVFALRHKSSVPVIENIWHRKAETFRVWPLAGKVYRPMIQDNSCLLLLRYRETERGESAARSPEKTVALQGLYNTAFPMLCPS